MGVPYGGVPYGYGFGYAPIGGIYGGGVYGGFGGGYVDGSFYQQNPYGPWGVPSLGPFDPYIMGGYGMYGMGYPGGEPPVYPDYGLGTGLPFSTHTCTHQLHSTVTVMEHHSAMVNTDMVLVVMDLVSVVLPHMEAFMVVYLIMDVKARAYHSLVETNL